MTGPSESAHSPGNGQGAGRPASSATCTHCGGTGFQMADAADGIARAKRCRCLGTDRLGGLLKSARIPRRYLPCTLENFDALNPSLDLARGQVRAFVEEYPLNEHGLLLMGPCGVGKTHLATAALLELIREKGVSGLFYDFRDLLKEIQASYNPVSGTTELGILQPIFGAEVLVLDDLGATRMTDWVRDTLSHIISNRYNESRVTLFTTNLEDDSDRRSIPDERLRDRPVLSEQIGAPLRSRLYEMCEVIRLDGKDYRKDVKHPGRRHEPRL